ncbi:MAG: carboxypeptidase regulatory-like domain-containing protein, partial [Acidobacteria bacterium]|nr:carboxypeptidase regulatory-like domain-containing protein [Acidobacteriota bacterium]
MRAQFVVLAFLLAAGSSVLLAQSYQGEIVGAVTDVSGSLIPEAQLSLIQMDTGRQQAARADAQGRFRFLQLPPGRYRLEVQHPGFRKSQQSLTLEVGSRALVDVALQVGELTESVVVSEEAPLVEAASGAVGMLVDNSRITSLPLNGRNAFELVALSPGVIPTGSFGQSDPWDKRAPASFSASGGRGLDNDLLLDGASATVGSELNLAAFSPALDAIQEFKVQLNSYAAEFGRSQGAVVNAVTRAGTNRFHGSAYDYLRNDNLDANNFFNNAGGRPKADLRWNQFGGTLGGPVVMPRLYDGRNRTFFFVSYEGMRYARGLSSLLRVPTSVERGGDFSQTVDARGLLVPIYDPSSTRPDPARPNRYLRSPFPGNRIPAGSLNPVAARVAPFYPLPNQKELFPAAPNFYFGGNFVYGSDQTLVKLDHSFSERHRLSFRYSHASDDRRNPLSYGNIASPVLGPNQEASQTALLEHTWLLRPTLVANLKLNFLRYGNTIATYGAGYKFADELGMPRSLEDQSDFPMFPAFNVVGMPVGFAPGPPMVRTRPFSWNPTGSLSWVRGAHGLKFGFDYRAIYANNFIPQAPSGNYTFTPGVTGGPDPDATGPTGSALASFLLGVPANGSFGKSLALALRNSYTAFYVQDDWRVNARLTLNIGLRWDNEGSFTERYDRLTYLDLGSPNPIAAAANANYSRILGQLRASAPATAAVLPATLDLRGGLGYATPEARRQMAPDRNNFAPRFAFAYALSPRWVVRGGFGIFYTPQTGFAVAAAGLAQGYEAVTRVSGLGADRTPVVTLSNPFPAGLVQPAGKSLGLATDNGGSITSTLHTNRGGYAEQWNLNVQRSLGRGAVVEVGYIGSHGVKLIGPQVDWNVPSPAVAALG